MKMMPLRRWLASGLVVVLAAAASWAADPTPSTRPFPGAANIRADMRADRTILQAGQPFWVTFTLTNLGSEPVALQVPDAAATAEQSAGEMGLPLEHVFSGLRYNGLSIHDARGDDWDQQVEVRPRGPVATIRLGANACVGTRVELTQYYRSLKRPGKYTLVWRPYFGAVESAPLNISLLAKRQAVILTEFGTITIRFYYDEAPHAVQNFTELVEQRFYDTLTFHKIIPFTLIQGGDPRGDGRGVGPNGRRIKAEFSKIPFEIGTVGMARLRGDPDSASCQFFICASRQPSFDGNETAFGHLYGEQSYETLKKIASVPTDSRYRPQRPIVIRTISLESVPGTPENSDFDSADKPITTRPAIMPPGTRSQRGLSQLDGPGPTTRPSTEGG